MTTTASTTASTTGTSLGTSLAPTTHERAGSRAGVGGTLRDRLPAIELTARVVEALRAENWHLHTDTSPEIAAALATARMLVVADRAADARRRAEIRAAWKAWEADRVAAQAAQAAQAAAGKAVAS